MKLFERSPAHWLFWTGAVYLMVVLYSIGNKKSIEPTVVQLIWLMCLILPFAVPPIGRWLNLDIEWDRKMLEWFSRKSDHKYQPEGLGASEYTEAKEFKPKDPSNTYYRIGLTNDNRISFQMGWSEITMNAQGVQNMIDQLKLFKQQISNNETN